MQHKTEALANLDKQLQYVQHYLSSGRPYPKGDIQASHSRNNTSFLQSQPNSDTVQSIVQRVLTAGHERENMIKHSPLDIPESVFEPQCKQAHDNLNNVMHNVIQVMHHPPVSPRHDSGTLAASINRTERVQKIKDQVKSSHQSILDGLKRSLSQPAKSHHQTLEHDMLASQRSHSGQIESEPRSLRQREIQSALSQTKQQIERSIQHHSSKNSQHSSTSSSPVNTSKDVG